MRDFGGVQNVYAYTLYREVTLIQENVSSDYDRIVIDFNHKVRSLQWMGTQKETLLREASYLRTGSQLKLTVYKGAAPDFD